MTYVTAHPLTHVTERFVQNGGPSDKPDLRLGDGLKNVCSCYCGVNKKDRPIFVFII